MEREGRGRIDAREERSSSLALASPLPRVCLALSSASLKNAKKKATCSVGQSRFDSGNHEKSLTNIIILEMWPVNSTSLTVR